MKKTSLLALSLLTLFSIQNVIYAQSMTEAERLADQERRSAETRSKLGGGTTNSNGMIKRNKEAADLSASSYKESKLSKKLREEQSKFKKLIAPNPQDIQKYDSLIKTSRGGLFRLFPHLNCQEKFVVNLNGNCANYTSGYSTYSFRRKDYEAEEGFIDIQFKDDELISRGFLSQSIITNLGNVPIEDVSLNNSGLAFLNKFIPQSATQAVKKQYNEITNGINENGYFYSNIVKAQLNTTYGMRIIAYHFTVPSHYDAEVMDNRFHAVNIDNRRDLTIAFRIIRKEDDGNITIVWKELNNQKPPKLNYRKDEKLEDFKPKN